jgi:hypothetical protein
LGWTVLGRYQDCTGSTDCGSGSEVSWRDAVVRLGNCHVVDNAIHVMRLRFSWTHGEPLAYTAYVNYSEILTVLLLAQMVAWTRMKYRARDGLLVEAMMEVEEGHVHEKLRIYEKSG